MGRHYPETGFFDLWRGVLSDPGRLFASERRSASVGGAMKHLAVGSALFSLLYAATFHFLPGMPSNAQPFALPRALLFALVNTVVGTAALFLIIAVNYAAARALGGTARFKEHAYFSAIIAAPSLVLYYVLRLFPGIGVLLGLLALVYYVYLNIQMLKQLHALGTPQAFAALFVPSAALVLVVLVMSGGAAAQAVI